MNLPISKADIKAARKRIKPHIHKTPVLTNKTLDMMSGVSLFFKCENFQKVGAFKARGAMNAVLCLTDDEKKKGVTTHSSGNHGQALAWAASIVGIPSYIVMPNNSPDVKIQAVKGYGAEVILCEPTLFSREETLVEVVERTNAIEIHPYNNYTVITGQATCAKEFLSQVDDLDFILAPIGGGGLLSGTALSVHYYSPETSVFGCEPQKADDAYRSYIQGKIIPSTDPNTIADGLKTSLGEKTFPIIHKLVEGIITVSEEEIMDAMKLIWERMNIVVEPSAAVSLAALLNRKEEFAGNRVGIVFTGGNLDLNKVGSLF